MTWPEYGLFIFVAGILVRSLTISATGQSRPEALCAAGWILTYLLFAAALVIFAVGALASLWALLGVAAACQFIVSTRWAQRRCTPSVNAVKGRDGKDEAA